MEKAGNCFGRSLYYIKSIMFSAILSCFHNFLYKKVAIFNVFISDKTAVFWHGKICLYKMLSPKKRLEGKKSIK